MNDLDQLKELLFGAEKEALDSISERVGRREIRTADVADILPEAIHQSHGKDKELVESLTQPVGECLQKAFEEDPETYGNALYPVMGPAIRKLIVQSLRTATEQINTAVEHSLSPKGLKWRLQAKRAGVPFGEFVVQKTMLYRVEQAYLISRENGLLVAHVHHEASRIKDSDAVSAMFTAIQDFVKESFSPDRTGRLESADMGEFTLWAVHGPHALLVCVIRGTPPRALRSELSAVLERIHFRYGDAIREYKGDTASVPDVAVELERCLRFEAQEKAAESRKGPSVAMIVVLLLLVAGAAFLIARSWQHSQQLTRLDAALTATPGIHVSDIDRDGGDIHVRGLRDPLASSVADVAAGLDIPADRVTVSMQPFQSLQPEIVARRAAQVLGEPATARISVAGTTLAVTGDAPYAWQRQLPARIGGLAGIDSLDVSGLTASDRQAFADEVANLGETTFFFRRGVEFADADETALREYGASLGALSLEAADFDYQLTVTLTGSTDPSGDSAANDALARARAVRVADILSDFAIKTRIAAEMKPSTFDAQPVEDASLRFVRIDVQAEPLP